MNKKSALRILKENAKGKSTITDTAMVEKIEGRENKSKVLIAAATLMIGTSMFAGDYTEWADTNSQDSFGDLLKTFIEWMTGNLGKMIALLGFIGTFVIYLFTHKGSVLFIGIIISVIAGGLVGIVATFFNYGSSAFAIKSATN